MRGELANTYRRQLHDRALDHYGYVTTADAADLDIPTGELRKLAARGGLEHIAYGVYRFEDIPRTARDEFFEALARTGPEAYLARDAVLALHDLALVNPRKIRVGNPVRTRAALPATIVVEVRDDDPDDLTMYDGIRATTVARALLDCQGIVMRDRLADAAREAVERGLLRRNEQAHVFTTLGVRA